MALIEHVQHCVMVEQRRPHIAFESLFSAKLRTEPVLHSSIRPKNLVVSEGRRGRLLSAALPKMLDSFSVGAALRNLLTNDISLNKFKMLI